MGKVIDLTGNTYGRLTVLGLDHKEKVKNGSVVYWRCRCSCENQTIVTVRAADLKSGNTKSCGCLNQEKRTTHGMYRDPIYNIWGHIKDRCNNSNCDRYKDYGGRGIKVCERWSKFENFYEDVSQLEHFGEKGYTLDRKDNNGNYEPSNVHWVKAKDQQRNKRNNIWVEYKGEKMILKDAAEKSGISYSTLRGRYKHGERGDELFRPVKK